MQAFQQSLAEAKRVATESAMEIRVITEYQYHIRDSITGWVYAACPKPRKPRAVLVPVGNPLGPAVTLPGKWDLVTAVRAVAALREKKDSLI